MSTPAGSGPPPATDAPRPPLPPFDHDSAVVKIRLAEDAWNSRNPEAVSRAYSPDSRWRNRDQFVNGRDEIVAFLTQKWERELDYRLIKELWAFTDRRIAVRFVYECHDATGQWFRCHGNENWQFNEAGLMTHRHASINDQRIEESERKYHWDAPGPRPPEHPGLTELGL